MDTTTTTTATAVMEETPPLQTDRAPETTERAAPPPPLPRTRSLSEVFEANSAAAKKSAWTRYRELLVKPDLTDAEIAELREVMVRLQKTEQAAMKDANTLRAAKSLSDAVAHMRELRREADAAERAMMESAARMQEGIAQIKAEHTKMISASDQARGNLSVAEERRRELSYLVRDNIELLADLNHFA